MCCHPVSGTHTSNEPPDCCHTHAEDLPANREDSDWFKYDSDGWRSVPDGWTAQTILVEQIERERRATLEEATVPDGRVLIGNVPGRFDLCVTCGMALTSERNDDHDCPALRNSRPMRDHIPPMGYRPRNPVTPDNV